MERLIDSWLNPDKLETDPKAGILHAVLLVQTPIILGLFIGLHWFIGRFDSRSLLVGFFGV